jgi:hypothetical protein
LKDQIKNETTEKTCTSYSCRIKSQVLKDFALNPRILSRPYLLLHFGCYKSDRLNKGEKKMGPFVFFRPFFPANKNSVRKGNKQNTGNVIARRTRLLDCAATT